MTLRSAAAISVSLTEATLTLGGLLAQDVALESLGAHKLAGTSLAETLLGAAVGLHLRHEILLNRLQNTSYLVSLAALSSSKAPLIGASSISMLRPSILGLDSTVA